MLKGQREGEGMGGGGKMGARERGRDGCMEGST